MRAYGSFLQASWARGAISASPKPRLIPLHFYLMRDLITAQPLNSKDLRRVGAHPLDLDYFFFTPAVWQPHIAKPDL